MWRQEGACAVLCLGQCKWEASNQGPDMTLFTSFRILQNISEYWMNGLPTVQALWSSGITSLKYACTQGWPHVEICVLAIQFLFIMDITIANLRRWPTGQACHLSGFLRHLQLTSHLIITFYSRHHIWSMVPPWVSSIYIMWKHEWTAWSKCEAATNAWAKCEGNSDWGNLLNVGHVWYWCCVWCGGYT